ncbi:MAG: hypothetical protein K0S65_4991, partial [Labilithrix sp.]|nr:hypothetical protein [Labilithrix sp.]
MPAYVRNRIRSSLLLLGAVLAIALIGLAVDGNGPKVLRVAAAGCAYAATLLVLTRHGSAGWWRFALAGLVAGMASGVFRADPGALTIAVDAIAATVVATVHWLGLAQSERLRR